MGKKTREQSGKHSPSSESTPFSTINYVLFAAGLLVIIAGWFLLRSGSITIAPVMLVLGYCGIIPLAIVLKRHKRVD